MCASHRALHTSWSLSWGLGREVQLLLCPRTLSPVWSRLCSSLAGVQGWGTPYTVILGWLLIACGDEDDEGQGRGNQCDQSPDWEDALDLVQPICTWWGEEASERLGQVPTRLEVGRR